MPRRRAAFKGRAAGETGRAQADQAHAGGDAGRRVLAVRTVRPTLEDAFIQLTGLEKR